MTGAARSLLATRAEAVDPSRTSPLSGKIGTSLAVILGLIALVQGFSPRLLPFERQLYGAIVLLLGGYVYFLLLYGAASLRQWLDLSLWLSVVALFAIPVLSQPTIYPSWVLGDAIVFVTPAVLVLIGKACPALYSQRNVLIYSGLAAIGAVVATHFQDASRFGRFQPPKIILYSLTWYFLFHGRSLRQRLIAGAAVIILFLLSWASAVRAAVILWLIAGSILALSPRSRALAALALVGLVIVMIDIWAIYGHQISGAIPESRFDRSDYVAGRQAEVLDAADHFLQQGNVVNYFFGFGFGATFKVNRLVGLLTEDPYEFGRVTREGTVHIFHFGPGRITFRYGLLGLWVFVALMIRVVGDIAALVFRGKAEDRSMVFAVFTVATFCYLLRSFEQPVENLLDFAYVLAGYIVLRGRVKSRVASPGGSQSAVAPGLEARSEDRRCFG